MPTVARPPIDPSPRILRKRRDTVAGTDPSQASRPAAMARMLRTVLEAVALASVEPDVPALEELLAAGAVAGAALFAGESGEGRQTTIRWLDGTEVVVAGGAPTSRTEPPLWRSALACAQASRTAWAVDVLAGVPVDTIVAGVEVVECEPRFVAATQAFLRADPRTPTLLLEAMRATDEDRLPADMVDSVLFTLEPQMELVHHLVTRDRAGFQAALAAAVTSHRDHHVVDGGHDDVWAYVALAPLGWACRAYDAGWPLTLESPYVPRAVVERTRAGGAPVP